MLQGLQSVLGELGSLMAAPDADVRFLMSLQMAITQKIKQGTQQAIQGQQQGAQQAIGGGMGPQRIGPGGGAGMSGFGGAAPAMAGGMAGAGGPGGPMGAGAGAPMGMANPDELRRVLGANAQTQ